MKKYILNLIKKGFEHKILLDACLSKQSLFNYKKTIRQFFKALRSHEVGILADKLTGDTSECVYEFSINIHEKKIIDRLLESYTKLAEPSTLVIFSDNHNTVIYKNRRLIFVLEEYIHLIEIPIQSGQDIVLLPSKF